MCKLILKLPSTVLRVNSQGSQGGFLAKFLNFFSTSHNRTHNHNICISHGEADIWNREKRPLAPFLISNLPRSNDGWKRTHLMWWECIYWDRCDVIATAFPLIAGFKRKLQNHPTIESSRRYLFKHEIKHWRCLHILTFQTICFAPLEWLTQSERIN